MALDHFISLSQQAIWAAGKLLIPLVGISLLVGIAVGLFQAVTQIQEQTLSFAPKLAAIAIVMLIAGPWFLNVLVDFASSVWGNMWMFIQIH